MRKRGIEIDSEVLRTLRRKQTLTQSELAQRADLSMLTVSNAERKGLVDASTLKKLAIALAVDVQDLHAKDIEEEVEYQSVFISYGGPDEVFARMVYDQLLAAGCHVFFFPESATPGEKLHRTMSDGVREFDRVLLICSRSSLGRTGVMNELERVLEREASEGGSDILIPINIDDYVFSDWHPERQDVAIQIRARVVLSFVGATTPGQEFDARFDRLLRAIQR